MGVTGVGHEVHQILCGARQVGEGHQDELGPGEELRGGLRLEQDYLVTDTGVERLTQFALDL